MARRYTAQLRSWEINIKCYTRKGGGGAEAGESEQTETDVMKWERREILTGEEDELGVGRGR